MQTFIKRSLGTVALAGGFLLAGAAMASANDTGNITHSATGSSISSPIEIGGSNAGISTQSSSSSGLSQTRTDQAGTSTSESRTSQDASKNTLGLSTGSTKVDPSAGLTQVTNNATVGKDNGRKASSATSRSTQAKGSAPIKVGGVSLTGTTERSSSNATKSTRANGNATRTSERSSQTASRTGAGLGTGDITANPSGTLSQATKGSSSSQDRGSNRNVSTTSSSTAGDLSSPVNLSGATASFTDQRASQDARKETVTDRQGTRSQSEQNGSASRTAGGLDVGAITADPAATLRDARTADQQSGNIGDNRGSTSRSALGLSAPVRGDGLGGSFSREDAQARDTESVVSNREGTTRHAESTESASREALGGQSGAFGSAPALGLDDTRNSTSVLGDDNTSSNRDSFTAARSALPFFSDGFAAAGDFAGTDARTTTDQVADENGTLTRTERSENAQRTTPGTSFDGLSGNPAGTFSLQDLMEQARSDR